MYVDLLDVRALDVNTTADEKFYIVDIRHMIDVTIKVINNDAADVLDWYVGGIHSLKPVPLTSIPGFRDDLEGTLAAPTAVAISSASDLVANKRGLPAATGKHYTHIVIVLNRNGAGQVDGLDLMVIGFPE